MTSRTRFALVTIACPTPTDGEATYNRFIKFEKLEDCNYQNIINILKKHLFRSLTLLNIIFFNEADFREFSKGCKIIEA